MHKTEEPKGQAGGLKGCVAHAAGGEDGMLGIFQGSMIVRPQRNL